jgi:hypothetical protein
LATTLIGPSATTSAANIIGGAGIDIITAAAGGGTITARGGLDKITLGAGADIVVLGITADSLDTISGFTGGTGKDVIQLGGTTAAVGKLVAEVGAIKQVSTITVAGTVEANEAITITGIATGSVSVTTGADAATTATAIKTAIDAAAGSTVDVTVLSGVVTLTAKIAGTAFTAVSTPANGTSATLGTGTTTTVATSTPNQTASGYAGAAHNIVFDTSSNLGALGVNIGDHSSEATANEKLLYAVASDTGAIYYDADGNWTTGAVQIGTIGVVTGLTAADNFTVAA